MSAPVSGILRSGITYAIGDLISVGLRYAPAVVYPLFLNPSEYGIFVVVTALTLVMGIVVGFGLKGAVFKQTFDYEKTEERKSLYGTIWLFAVVAGAALTLVIDVTWGAFFRDVLGSVPYDPYIRLAIWTAYLNVFGIVLFEIYRAQTKAALYMVFSVANAATLVAFALLFVTVLKLGLLGAVLAPAATGLVWAAVYTIALVPHLRFGFDIQKLRKALAYGLPLIPHQIGHWMLNLSDRIILERSVPIADLGVYGFGYNLGNVQQVLANAGNSALMPNYGLAIKDASKRKMLPALFGRYLVWVAAGALAISIFSDGFIAAFMPASFSAAGSIVPWVALGFFCVSLYYGPMDALTVLAGETRWVWLLTVFAGGVNIGANFLFVPLLGIQAAAMNTLLGYVVLFGLVYVYSRRFVTVVYPWNQIFILCAALAAGVLIDRAIIFPNLWMETVVDLGLFGGFVGYFLVGRRSG